MRCKYLGDLSEQETQIYQLLCFASPSKTKVIVQGGGTMSCEVGWYLYGPNHSHSVSDLPHTIETSLVH